MLLEGARSALVAVVHCDDAEWMFRGMVARLVGQESSECAVTFLGHRNDEPQVASSSSVSGLKG